MGGFDEKHLPVNFQDVDFCLRLWAHGYRVVFTPFAKLHHVESPSRDTTVADSECNYMWDTWRPTLENDPFYSPNLSRTSTDYTPDRCPSHRASMRVFFREGKRYSANVPQRGGKSPGERALQIFDLVS